MKRSEIVTTKTFLLTVITLFLFNHAMATESTLSETVPSANILKTDWNVEGSLVFLKYSGRYDNSSNYSFSSNVQYFLVDRFSLGLLIGYEKETDSSPIASAGPVASYYFWQDGKIATFVRGFYRMGLTNSTVDSIVGGSLGAHYFIVPSVSFGPSIFYNYNDSGYSNYSRTGISLGFGLYF